MKKIVLGILLVGISLYAKEPISYGIFKGSIKSYYPNLKVTNVFLMSNSSTTGMTKNKPQTLIDTSIKFVKSFSKDAKKECKNSYGYAIDNVNTKYTTFGDYSNTFIYVSANIVCFNK